VGVESFGQLDPVGQVADQAEGQDPGGGAG
jgi:hypothetical protein